MSVKYRTKVIGEGNHASLEIPDEVLTRLGANRRAPLKITINGHTYQSTATGVGGRCRVVFPQRERALAKAKAGDVVTVLLELDSGYREVELPAELAATLKKLKLQQTFNELTYSKRKRFALGVAQAQSPQTKQKRIEKVVAELLA